MSLGFFFFFCHPCYSCFLYKVCCSLRRGKLGVTQLYGGTPSFQRRSLAQKKNQTVLQVQLAPQASGPVRVLGFASFALDPSSVGSLSYSLELRCGWHQCCKEIKHDFSEVQELLGGTSPLLHTLLYSRDLWRGNSTGASWSQLSLPAESTFL